MRTLRVQTPIEGEWVLDDGQHVPLGRAVLVEIGEEWPDLILEWVLAEARPWAGRSVVAYVLTWAGQRWTVPMVTAVALGPGAATTFQRLRWDVGPEVGWGGADPDPEYKGPPA